MSNDRFKFRVWIHEDISDFTDIAGLRIGWLKDQVAWFNIGSNGDIQWSYYEEPAPPLYHGKNVTIEFCTGLTAKKSYRGERREDLLLFENDLIKIGNSIHQVVWKDNSYRYYNDGAYWLLSANNKYEIIGTIHENPELL